MKPPPQGPRSAVPKVLRRARFPGLPLPHRLPLETAISIGEFALRTIQPGPVPVLPTGRHYVLVHGPNVYPSPYNGEATAWSGAYLAPATGTGPQTGLISNQARSSTWPTFEAWVAAHTDGFDPGWWIPRPDQQRWASFVALQSVRPYSLSQNPALAFRPPWHVLWRRVTPDFAPAPRVQPAPWARPIPQPAPLLIPPPYHGWPSELPVLPWVRPQPGVPGYGFEGQPSPEPKPAPTLPPSVTPVVRVATATGGGVTRSRGHHKAAPPRPREREGKNYVDRGLWQAMNGLGMVTEGFDLVEVAHSALPKSMQAKSWHKGKPIKPSLKKQLGAVWKGWRHIDPQKLAVGYVMNQIEDNLIGRISSQVDKYDPNRLKGISPTSRVLDLSALSDMLGVTEDWLLSHLKGMK